MVQKLNSTIIPDIPYMSPTRPTAKTFMKIYDTNYGPDTFGRIRMGLITEMFLTFDGFMKPDVGDHLRISCMFKGVVREVYTVVIIDMADCVDEPSTVLIRVEEKSVVDISGSTINSAQEIHPLNVLPGMLLH
ncbi:hypothetical protein NS375_17700 [Pantoea dispersa]|nr:hypothetical protein NS375_17700 [Pantoea dispersa]